MKFEINQNGLVCRRQGETLRIEPWGRDSLRVRAAMGPEVLDIDWALTEEVEKPQWRNAALPSARSGEARAGKALSARHPHARRGQLGHEQR